MVHISLIQTSGYQTFKKTTLAGCLPDSEGATHEKPCVSKCPDTNQQLNLIFSLSTDGTL